MENNKYQNIPKGKIPPQAIDIEIAVLGAMLVDSKAPPQAIEILKHESVFYKEKHNLIYKAMLELFEESEPIDLLTVSERLRYLNKLEKIGGDLYLIELSTAVASSAHIEIHCRILQQKYIQRESITIGNLMITQAYTDDCDIVDVIEDSYKKLDEVSDWAFSRKAKNFKEQTDDFFSDSKELKKGIPGELKLLNSKLNGYQDENLIILAARPGMGKTALMLNEALGAAKQNIPVGIFSLEMGARELIARLLACYCGINVENVSLNKCTDFEIRHMESKRDEFSKLPIHINDTAGITPLELKIQANRWQREQGIKMIFIDYLQLMNSNTKSRAGNREQEVSAISSSLKALAKELKIPVMALSQLSRSVEQRGGMKRPMLSDLRESGAIEQDADIVMFLLRPEYYKISEWDDDERTPTEGTAEINIAKFRNGKTTQILVGCDLSMMQFFDLKPKDEHMPWNQNADDFDPTPEPNQMPKIDPWTDDDMPF